MSKVNTAFQAVLPEVRPKLLQHDLDRELNHTVSNTILALEAFSYQAWAMGLFVCMSVCMYVSDDDRARRSYVMALDHRSAHWGREKQKKMMIVMQAAAGSYIHTSRRPKSSGERTRANFMISPKPLMTFRAHWVLMKDLSNKAAEGA